MNVRRGVIYLQLKTDRYNNVVLERASTKKPRARVGGTLLVKLSLEIPSAAFEPLEPEAIVRIPATLTDARPIEVEATDPRE